MGAYRYLIPHQNTAFSGAHSLKFPDRAGSFRTGRNHRCLRNLKASDSFGTRIRVCADFISGVDLLEETIPCNLHTYNFKL